MVAKKKSSKSNAGKLKASKSMTLGEIVQKFPHAGALLAEAGLHCIGCHISAFETLEQGCRAHGLSDKEIENLVKSINSSL